MHSSANFASTIENMPPYGAVSPGTTADASRRGSIVSTRRSPMMDIPKIGRAHIESWLSAPRYGKYLEASGNNDTIALDLYLWDIGLAQAVLKDVSFFEVALKNAYNRTISSTWSGTDHWPFDDASPVRRPILRKNKRGQVNDANRLNRNSIDHLRNGLRENATIDDVISNLTLGFWAHMTDRSHERDLWIPSIPEHSISSRRHKPRTRPGTTVRPAVPQTIHTHSRNRESKT